MRIEKLTPEDWANVNPTRWQLFARYLVGRPGRYLMRYKGYGHEPRVPKEGGFLLAPGPHGAFVDPFLYGLGQRRPRLRFMANQHVLRWWIIGRMVKRAGGFPVIRGGNKSAAALETARMVIERGEGLVVFMEGHLVLDRVGLGTPRNGLARLALATGCPVVPVAAWGAKRAEAYGKKWWRHRPKITVVWGKFLQFPKEESPTDERVAEVRDEIWAQVTKCFEQARQIAETPGGRPPAGGIDSEGHERPPRSRRQRRRAVSGKL